MNFTVAFYSYLIGQTVSHSLAQSWKWTKKNEHEKESWVILPVGFAISTEQKSEQRGKARDDTSRGEIGKRQSWSRRWKMRVELWSG